MLNSSVSSHLFLSHLQINSPFPPYIFFFALHCGPTDTSFHKPKITPLNGKPFETHTQVAILCFLQHQPREPPNEKPRAKSRCHSGLISVFFVLIPISQIRPSTHLGFTGTFPILILKSTLPGISTVPGKSAKCVSSQNSLYRMELRVQMTQKNIASLKMLNLMHDLPPSRLGHSVVLLPCEEGLTHKPTNANTSKALDQTRGPLRYKCHTEKPSLKHSAGKCHIHSRLLSMFQKDPWAWRLGMKKFINVHYVVFCGILARKGQLVGPMYQNIEYDFYFLFIFLEYDF